jgi:hypothetical protein
MASRLDPGPVVIGLTLLHWSLWARLGLSRICVVQGYRLIDLESGIVV